ncbi:MAG: MBL fold metallo-hydrolase [Thermodesulfobacteriota bacterium]|nr:MBL fold metallo-hydrolase [Thermodesulfobacteriota bacterium]
MSDVVYGNKPETILRADHRFSARRTNHVLLGTWLHVLSRHGEWIRVETAGRGPGGWVHSGDVRDTPCLKVFFVDVGQGDGAVVESPNGNLLIDGGPSKDFHAFLRHLYGPTIDSGQKIDFDAVVVSHPDTDHYRGLTRVLNDSDFTFGTIYHNGIIRYHGSKPAGKPFDLGQVKTDGQGGKILSETFSTLDQADQLINGGQLMATFRDFWKAAQNAHHNGRLTSARRVTVRDATLPGFQSEESAKLRVDVLGPVATSDSGRVEYGTFPDPHKHPSLEPSSSHTRNGHSVVLKLVFGDHSFLFGGDLNIPAQKHLLGAWGDRNPFQVDVAKACHHGSSDFSVDFLKKVRPRVNVFSSGDNKSFDHPMADAVGAAGRHTRGDHPLLFLTELARAETRSRTHYGLINARSNGTSLVMAQMKEQHKKVDVWDSYTVPWRGRFPEAV